MDKIIYIVSVLVLLLVSDCYSQETKKEKSVKEDTVQELNNDSLINKIKSDEFLHGEFPLIYNNNHNTNLGSVQVTPGIRLNPAKGVPYPLASFNKNLHNYVAFCYKNQPNYDLGIVGRYLHIIRKFAALYLALLAVM